MAITKIEVPELFDFGSDNSAFKLPTGTTAERPTSPSNGEMRFNTTTGYVEYYDTTDTQWWEIDYEALCTTNDPNYPITNVAYYKMSSAADEKGTYNGTATNVNFNVAGKFGNAGEFNGSSSSIVLSIPNAAQATINSIFAWVKFNSIGTNQAITSLGDTTSDNSPFWFRLEGSTNKIRLIATNNSSASESIYSTTVISANTWYNVGAVWTGNSWKLYINGSNEATTSSTTSRTPSVGNVAYLGQVYRSGFTNQQTLNGLIDQVRIFDSALSASQVTQLYNEIQCVPTIVPTDHFEPVIYNGNGSTKSITTLDFQPDMIWVKARTVAYDHGLVDSVRGTTSLLYPDLAQAASTGVTNAIQSFNSDGFTWGSNNKGNASNSTYVAWNWKAGGAAVSNTDGTITSQVSANVDAGFSIATWTGNNSASNIGHGLGGVPELWIIKNRTGTNSWVVGMPNAIGVGYLVLNNNSAFSTSNIWGTIPDSTKYYFNTAAGGNGHLSTGNYVGYFFRSIAGYSKIGSYIGTGATGNSIVTGFRPAFVMIKKSTGTGAWFMHDNERLSGTGYSDKYLQANSNAAEVDSSDNDLLKFDLNGFTLNTTFGDYNASGATYIFMAFAAT